MSYKGVDISYAEMAQRHARKLVRPEPPKKAAHWAEGLPFAYPINRWTGAMLFDTVDESVNNYKLDIDRLIYNLRIVENRQKVAANIANSKKKVVVSTKRTFNVLPIDEIEDFKPLLKHNFPNKNHKKVKIVKRMRTLPRGPKKPFDWRTRKLEMPVVKYNHLLVLRVRYVIDTLRDYRLGLIDNKFIAFKFVNLGVALREMFKERKDFAQSESLKNPGVPEDLKRMDDEIELDHEMDVSTLAAKDDQQSEVAANTEIVVGADIPQVVAPTTRVYQDNQFNVIEYLSKWNHLTTISWNSSHPFNHELLNLSVLGDCLNSLRDSPFVIPFICAQFFSGDVEFLFTINTNQFMCGQLLVAFVYGGDLTEVGSDCMKHVYSLSQKDHVVMNASSCQESILRVGFKYPLDQLMVTVLSAFDKCNFGQLVCKVLSPLCAAGGDAVSSTMTVAVRVIDAKFSGMVSMAMKPTDESQLDHEMLPVALNIANKLLSPDNCDLPPAVASRSSVSLVASSSLSIGTGAVESIERLRLDGMSSTPHDLGNRGFDISTVISRPGIIDSFVISSSSQVGSIVYKKEVSPLSNKTNYAKSIEKTNSAFDCVVVPPVGVVASMMGYFRGSLDYKFSIVSSAFHACKIVVAFIPGPVRKSSSISAQVLRSSYHQQFDILLDKEFTFTVPYISNQVFYPRLVSSRVGSSYMEPYGHIYVQLVSSLYTNSTISSSINVIVYLSGGKDLEFSIPTCPALLPSYDREDAHLALYDEIYAKSGYYPYYAGTWRNLYGEISIDKDTKASVYVPVLRYGAVSDHIAQFVPAHPYSVYKLLAPSQKDIKFQMYLTDQKTKNNISWVCPIFDGTYQYIIPFNSLEKAIKFSKLAAQGQCWGDLTKVTKIYLASAVAQNFVYYTKSSTAGDNYIGDVSPTWKFEQMLEHQIGDLGTQHQVSPMSLLHFGENSSNLKDLCRRYHPYCEVNIPNPLPFLTASTIVPIQPWGVSLENDFEDSTSLRSPIGLIASGFVFFKGGLKFTIVCDKPNINFWVQHRFDDFNTYDSVKVLADTNAQFVGLLPGYATTFHSSDTNRVFKIEVPYYSPCNRIYANKAAVELSQYRSQFFNLGSLVIGVSNPCKLAILYAISDDAAFSEFVGFPPMIFASEVGSSYHKPSVGFEELEHEMISLIGASQQKKIDAAVSKADMAIENINDSVSVVKEKLSVVLDQGNDVLCKISESATNVTANVEKLQQHSANVIDSVGADCSVAMNEVKDKVNGLVDKTSVSVDEIVSNVSSKIDDLGNKLGDTFLARAKDSVLLFITNVLHTVVASVKDMWKHLMITVGSMFTSICGFSSDLCNKIVNCFKRLYSSSYCGDKVLVGQQDPSEGELSHEADDDNLRDIASDLVGLIVGGISAATQIKAAKHTRGFVSYTNEFIVGLPKHVRGTQNIMNFFKAIWGLLERIYLRFRNWICPKLALMDPLLNQFDRIKEWVEEVMFLTHPEQWEKIVSCELYQKRVDIAYEYGQELQFVIAAVDKGSSLKDIRRLIELNFMEITKLRDRCNREKIYIGADKEPFFIYTWGAPGIGKTTLKDFICPAMLRQAQIKVNGSIFYTVPLNSEFWTGALNQPVCYIDDFNVVVNDPMTSLFADIINMKSPTVFKPNQADIKDKGRPYSPEILYVSSNKEFPQINGVSDLGAFMRRPEMFVQVRMKDEYLRQNFHKIADLPEAIQRTVVPRFEHLIFGVGTYNGEFGPDTVINYRYYEYKDFCHVLISKFLAYRTKQLILSETRFKQQIKLENFSDGHEFLLRAGKMLFGKDLKAKSPNDLYEQIEQAVAQATIDSNDSALNKSLGKVIELGKSDDEEAAAGIVEYDPDYVPVEAEPRGVHRVPQEVFNHRPRNNRGGNNRNRRPQEPNGRWQRLDHEMDTGDIIGLFENEVPAITNPGPSITTEPTVVDCGVNNTGVPSDYDSGDEYEPRKPTLRPYFGAKKENTSRVWAPGARHFGPADQVFLGNSRWGHYCVYASKNNECEDKLRYYWKSDSFVSSVLTDSEIAIINSNICGEGMIIPDGKKNTLCVQAFKKVVRKRIPWHHISTLEKNEIITDPNRPCPEYFMPRIHDVDDFVFNSDFIIMGVHKEFIVVRWMLKDIGDMYGKLYIEDLSNNLLEILFMRRKAVLLQYFEENNDPALFPTALGQLCAKELTVWAKIKNNFIMAMRKLKEVLSEAISTVAKGIMKTINFIMRYRFVIWAVLMGAIVGLGFFGISLSATNSDYVSPPRSVRCDKVGNNYKLENEAVSIGSSGMSVRSRASTRDSVYSHTYKPHSPGYMEHEHSALSNQVLERICRNTFFLTFKMITGEVVNHRVFCVGGNTIVFPRHYREWAKGAIDSIDTFTITHGPLVIPLNLKDFVNNSHHFSSTSLEKYVLPPQFPPQRSCQNFMQLGSISYSNVGQLVVPADKTSYVYTTPVRVGSINVKSSDVLSSVYCELGYKYDVHAKGFCGSILVLDNKIVGMHVAGGYNVGAAEPLVDKVVDHSDNYVLDEYPEQLEGFVTLKNSGVYDPIGEVVPSMRSFNPIESEIVGTAFCEEIEVPCRPALIGPYRSGDTLRYPLWEGVQHHLSTPLNLDSKLVKEAALHYSETIMASAKPVRSKVGVLSMEEAADGFVGNEYYKSVDRKSSVGWPFIRYGREWNAKTAVIGPAGECVIKPELRLKVESQIDKRKKGLIQPTVFDDKLKDEVLPNEKALKVGGTRIISCSPIDYTLTCKMYFQDFVSAMSSGNFKTECAVGMNVLGSDWNELMMYMHEFSTLGFDGDYSKFGPTLSSIVINECVEIINGWYLLHDKNCTVEDNRVRKCLLIELMHAIHLADRKLYRTVCGAPSGSPLTVVLNSMVNCIYMRMVYKEINSSLSRFNKDVRIITYGDDILASVRNKSRFNFKMVSEIFSKWGIKFTAAAKDGAVVELVPLKNCTFLKSEIVQRRFKNYNVFLYKLSEDSLKKMLCYVRVSKFNTPKDSITENCKTVLSYAIAHGKEKFNAYSSLIKSVMLRAYQVKVEVPSFEIVQDVLLSNRVSGTDPNIGVVFSNL